MTMSAYAVPGIVPGQKVDRPNFDALQYVLEKLGDRYKIPYDKLIRVGRSVPCVYVRQLFCYYMHIEYKVSYRLIGLVLGQDHTTILHSINSLKDRIKSHESIPGYVDSVKLDFIEVKIPIRQSVYEYQCEGKRVTKKYRMNVKFDTKGSLVDGSIDKVNPTTGTVVATFPSIAMAAQNIHVTRMRLEVSLFHPMRQLKGFLWRYS